MARVLILSLVFGPDTVSTANLMTDLAHGLKEHGHQVTVLTSMPHYNPAPEVLANPAFRRRLPAVLIEATEEGVRVLRVYMPLKGQRIWRRIMDYSWFHIVTILVAALKAGRHEVIFIPSPPITLGLSGWLLTLLLGGKLIYNVQELWPDVPVRMGLLRNPLLVRLVYGVESFVYRRASAVASIARSFNDILRVRGVPESKLFFTPNFVDVEWMRPGPKDNDFSQQQGLTDRFVVFYAGNIGLTQGMEVLIEAAREFEQDELVQFLVIGDGAGRARFLEAVQRSGLTNIRVLPFQPYHRVPQTYATADVCVSPMRPGFSYDTLPSKINTAMAAGRPVIAACESDSETARILRESGGGIVVAPQSATEMAAAIRKLYDSPGLAGELGSRGRAWVTTHCSRSGVISTYDRVIAAALGDRS